MVLSRMSLKLEAVSIKSINIPTNDSMACARCKNTIRSYEIYREIRITSSNISEADKTNRLICKTCRDELIDAEIQWIKLRYTEYIKISWHSRTDGGVKF